MAEMTIDLHGMPLAEAYDELEAQTRAVLEGIDDRRCCNGDNERAHSQRIWSSVDGFLPCRRAGALLRVGPYQGSLGCLEIEFGRGVCGTAAATKQTQIVEDVMTFPGHITCDARSRSEIVVPVFRSRR